MPLPVLPPEQAGACGRRSSQRYMSPHIEADAARVSGRGEAAPCVQRRALTSPRSRTLRLAILANLHLAETPEWASRALTGSNPRNEDAATPAGSHRSQSPALALPTPRWKRHELLDGRELPAQGRERPGRNRRCKPVRYPPIGQGWGVVSRWDCMRHLASALAAGLARRDCRLWLRAGVVGHLEWGRCWPGQAGQADPRLDQRAGVHRVVRQERAMVGDLRQGRAAGIRRLRVRHAGLAPVSSGQG